MSTNSGASWNSVSKTPTAALAVRDSILFACGNGLWKTTDRGVNWTEIDSASNLVSICVDSTTIYVGGVDTFQYSNDDGQSWAPTSRFADSVFTDGNIVTQIVAHGSILLVNINTGNAFGFAGVAGTFRSLDGGKTWVRCSISANALIYVGSKLIGFGEGSYTSDDDGASWQYHPSDLTSGTCLIFEWNLLFGGTSKDGVFQSTDSGVSWNQVSTGLPQEYTSLLAIGTELFATGYDRTFASSDDGANWNITHVFDTSGGLGISSVALSIGDSDYFVSTNDGVIYFSPIRVYRGTISNHSSSMPRPWPLYTSGYFIWITMKSWVHRIVEHHGV